MSKEKTFKEIMEDTSKSLEGIINIASYWRDRCLAAEEYIEQSPCDPDITKNQIIAHDYWQLMKKRFPNVNEQLKKQEHEDNIS